MDSIDFLMSDLETSESSSEEESDEEEEAPAKRKAAADSSSEEESDELVVPTRTVYASRSVQDDFVKEDEGHE